MEESGVLIKISNPPRRIHGIIENEDGPICTNVVKVVPVARHYEDEGEPEYIKYTCPVCDSIGCKHQVLPYEDNCSICKVNLDWSGYEKD